MQNNEHALKAEFPEVRIIKSLTKYGNDYEGIDIFRVIRPRPLNSEVDLGLNVCLPKKQITVDQYHKRVELLKSSWYATQKQVDNEKRQEPPTELDQPSEVEV